MLQPFGDLVERKPHLADVERRVEVAFQRFEVAVLIVVPPGDLSDQQKLLFADVGGELLDRPAEVARLLQRDVLECVDAESVAVGQCDPVLVALGQVGEYTG